MDITPAVAADLGDVVDLWNREGGPTSLPGGFGEAEALLARDPGALLTARVDGKLIGTLIVGWDGWRCHLYRLVVEPSWRRKGIGHRLVAAAAERAASLGAKRIDAIVALSNGTAVGFWEAQQYVHDPLNGRWTFRTQIPGRP